MTRLPLILMTLLAVAAAGRCDSELSHLGEFRVNTATAGDQAAPRVAMDGAGNFIVVYEGIDASGTGIYAQRYNAACSPVGPEFLVNSVTANDQREPSVSMARDGRYVIVWTTYSGGVATGITGRLYQADGTLVREFPASGTEMGELHYPSVAMDSSGRFIVGWHRGTGSGNERVWGQQFSSAGNPVRSAFQVQPGYAPANTLCSVATNASGDFIFVWFADVDEGQAIFARVYHQDGSTRIPVTRVSAPVAGVNEHPSVFLRDDGSYVVAWFEATGSDGSGYGIFGKAFSSAGIETPAAALAPINTATGGNQSAPGLALGPSGEYAVVYRSALFDGNGDAVAVQRYDAANTRVGAEFQANTYAVGDQQTKYGTGACAYDGAGNLLVVWQSAGQDGSGFGVYADKFYLPNQGPPLSEFRVNSTTAGDQRNPAVAMNGAGEAVVVWEGSDGNGRGLFAQRFDGQGRRVGGEIPVNKTTAGDQTMADVGVSDAGTFAVAWVQSDGDGLGVFTRVFGPDNSILRDEIRVHVGVTANDQEAPSLAMAPDGRFVIAWQCGGGADGSADGVFAQRFAADGSFRGSTILVNATTFGFQNSPSVAIRPNGDFLVCWAGDDTSATTQTSSRIFLRRFDDSGATQPGQDVLISGSRSSQGEPTASYQQDGSSLLAWGALGVGSNPSQVLGLHLAAEGSNVVSFEFPVGDVTVSAQSYPSVATAADGRTIVVWLQGGLDPDAGSFGIQARRFTANGGTIASQASVNRYTLGDQRYAQYGHHVAVDRDGNYMVVWHSSAQDGSGYGVYAARVEAPQPPKITNTGAADATGDSVTLSGSVNPGSAPTSVYFEYGSSPSLGFVTPTQSIGNGNADVPVTARVEGLLAANQYFYRMVAQNAESEAIQGAIKVFTTQADRKLPEAQPPTRPLRVVTPGGLPWRLVGRAAWQNSGDTIQVAPGEYLVECQPALPNQPVPPPVRIFISAGNTLETRTIDPLPSSGGGGSLVVIIEPDAVAASSVVREERGQWRFVGETDETLWRNGGLAGLPLAAGAYSIEFRQVDGKVGVAPRTVVIQPGQTTQVRVFYEDETQIPPGAVQPQPIAGNEVDTPPYCFAGQILSDAGSGSGTVVKPRVVLTAAHVVFDDVTLTYTTGVKWHFQRERGTVEPAALVPRGTYVFSSYAQVRLDARTRLGVGQATQVSQQRDAAALYFTREAGRFGYTDVLATGDTLATEWLANLDANTGQPRRKTLVSYPVDLNFLKAQNGYSELDAGRMFRTAPAAVAMTKITAESLPAGVTEADSRLGTNRVYQTTALAGYAGCSGGALWVEYDDGEYYPAGIYVGGTDRCVVRAIDAPVVDLIGRADSSSQASSDQNNTGGGIARVLSVSTNASYTSAKLQVSFTGLSANDLASAFWTVDPSPKRYFGSDARFVGAGTYTLRFAKIAGYREPRPFVVTVHSTDDVVVEAQYVEMTAPTITTSALKRAETGQGYTFQLQAAGSPTGYEVVSTEVAGLTVSSRGLLTAASILQPPGSYRVAVKASKGMDSMTRTFSLAVVARGHLEVRHRDVTDPLNVQALNARIDGSFDTKVVDDVVTLTAVPQRGLVFKQWTGFGIENLPTTNPRLSFVMKPLVILYAEFVQNPFTGRTGTYRGLVEETPAKADTTGLVQVTLSGNGRFTGSVTLAAGIYGFGGKFGVDGSYRGQVARPRRSASEPARQPLDLELSLDPGASRDAVVRGTLAGDFTASSAVRTAVSFSARLPATLGGAARVYTLAVPVDPSVSATDAGKPHGTSVASLAVSPSGSVRTTLLLADGSTTSVAGYFNRSEAGAPGQFATPLFTPLYKGHGSFAGTIVLNSTTNVLSGETHWFRDAFAAQPPLNGSWPAGLRATVRGELLPRPSTTVPIFANFPFRPLTTINGQKYDSVEFRFAEANAFNFSGVIGATGVFFENPGQTGGFNVKVDPKTGLVRGDYQPPVPGSNPPVFSTLRKFTGAILRSENKAVGATLSQIPASDDTNAAWELVQTP